MDAGVRLNKRKERVWGPALQTASGHRADTVAVGDLFKMAQTPGFGDRGSGPAQGETGWRAGKGTLKNAGTANARAATAGELRRGLLGGGSAGLSPKACRRARAGCGSEVRAVARGLLAGGQDSQEIRPALQDAREAALGNRPPQLLPYGPSEGAGVPGRPPGTVPWSRRGSVARSGGSPGGKES